MQILARIIDRVTADAEGVELTPTEQRWADIEEAATAAVLAFQRHPRLFATLPGNVRNRLEALARVIDAPSPDPDKLPVVHLGPFPIGGA